MKLLIATQNKGKVQEYQEMLDELDVEWLSLGDVGLGDMDVEENGQSFAENASIKVQAYHEASGGLWTLADDSGLVVDALNGQPGIYSARYGAPQAKTDADRLQLLLHNMQGIAPQKRTARFVCVVAIAAPGHKIITTEGFFEGHIADAPRGHNGFGYDPIFITDDGRTSAELSPAEKHAISHRGDALRNVLPILREMITTSLQ